MTPATFRAARKTLGFKSQLALAQHLDLSERTVQAWESEGPPRLASLWAEAEIMGQRRLRLLQELAPTS